MTVPGLRPCPNPHCHSAHILRSDRALDTAYYATGPYRTTWCVDCGLTGPRAMFQDAADRFWNELPRVEESC